MDHDGKSLIPDPDTVSPTFMPPIPTPVPIPMPSTEKESKSHTNSKTMPKPETTKDNLQYK